MMKQDIQLPLSKAYRSTTHQQRDQPSTGFERVHCFPYLCYAERSITSK